MNPTTTQSQSAMTNLDAFNQLKEAFPETSPIVLGRMLWRINKLTQISNGGSVFDMQAEKIELDAASFKSLSTSPEDTVQADRIRDERLDALENTKSMLNYETIYHSEKRLNPMTVLLLKKILEHSQDLDQVRVLLQEDSWSEARLADLLTALSMEMQITDLQPTESYSSMEELIQDVTTAPRPYDLVGVTSFVLAKKLAQIDNQLRIVTSEIELKRQAALQNQFSELSLDGAEVEFERANLFNQEKEERNAELASLEFQIELLKKKFNTYNWLANFSREELNLEPKIFDGSNINFMARLDPDSVVFNEIYELCRQNLNLVNLVHEFRLCFRLKDQKNVEQVYPTKTLQPNQMFQIGKAVLLRLDSETEPVKIMTSCLIGERIGEIYRASEINHETVGNFQKLLAEKRLPVWALEILWEILPPNESEANNYDLYYRRLESNINNIAWANFIVSLKNDHDQAQELSSELKETLHLIKRVNYWWAFQGKILVERPDTAEVIQSYEQKMIRQFSTHNPFLPLGLYRSEQASAEEQKAGRDAIELTQSETKLNDIFPKFEETLITAWNLFKAKLKDPNVDPDEKWREFKIR
ncbi:MAG: hypothetical protein OHK0017_01970 [Patescibacteria group bacterium]